MIAQAARGVVRGLGESLLRLAENTCGERPQSPSHIGGSLSARTLDTVLCVGLFEAMGGVVSRYAPALALGWLSTMMPFAAAHAVSLGGRELSRETVVVYLFIGHSNMLSDDRIDSHPRAFNYLIPGGWQRTEGWTLARNPLHVCTDGPKPRLGPGLPFLFHLAEQNPGYYIGMLQNAHPSATVTWLWPSPCCGDTETDSFRYMKGGGLYDEIVSRVIALHSDVTLGGVIAMLGLAESYDAESASRFASDFVAMAQAMRDDLGIPDLPFLIGQGEWEAHSKGAHYQTVRDGILTIPALLPHSAIIDVDFTFEEHYADSHHYNDLGATLWADRAVEIILENGWFPRASTPHLGLGSDSIRFCGEVSASELLHRPMTIANTGGGTLGAVTAQVSFGAGDGWLTIDNHLAGEGGVIENVVNPSGLAEGTYEATVTIACADAVNSPQSYDVLLDIRPSFALTHLSVLPERARVGTNEDLVLTATTLNECGDPKIMTDVSWSVDVEGGTVSPTASQTGAVYQATFVPSGAVGTFSVVVTAGVLRASAEVEVFPIPVLELTRPIGGEVWTIGAMELIEWRAENVSDATILFSTDDGVSWTQIATTIGSADPDWGSLSWTVPDVRTSEARIHIEGYFGESPDTSAPFSIRADSASAQATPPRGCSDSGVGRGSFVMLLLLVILGLARRSSEDRGNCT